MKWHGNTFYIGRTGVSVHRSDFHMRGTYFSATGRHTIEIPCFLVEGDNKVAKRLGRQIGIRLAYEERTIQEKRFHDAETLGAPQHKFDPRKQKKERRRQITWYGRE